MTTVRRLLEAKEGASNFAVSTTDTVLDALKVMTNAKVGAVLVTENHKIVGIFTERDVVRILVGGRDLDVPIAEEMVKDPMTICEGDSVALAIRRMAENGYRRLPVVDESNRPVGLVDVEGIVHFLVQDFPEAVYNLPPVANPATREREGP